MVILNNGNGSMNKVNQADSTRECKPMTVNAVLVDGDLFIYSNDFDVLSILVE